MNEPVEKSSEQSVVIRALALRAKMASDDLYKQYILCAVKSENNLKAKSTDFTFWPDGDDFTDWDDSR
jgi:hypothetical protein